LIASFTSLDQKKKKLGQMPKCCSIVSFSPTFPSPNFLGHKNWSKFYEFLTHLLNTHSLHGLELESSASNSSCLEKLNSIPFARSSQHMNLNLGGVT
jgi:hypothetical protein